MKAYKGFDKDLKCRGFQYEIGKTYETNEADLCNRGFHACLYPNDTFNYYEPSESRYCVVEIEGVTEQRSDDTKICGTKITIVKELTLADLAAESIDYIMNKIDKNKKESATGDMSSASNTGDRSSASNTGGRSSASNTGDRSSASNTGDRSSASNTGDRSSASNTGDRSSASNTGDWSSASNTGDWSSASVSGIDSVAVAIGYDSKAKACLGSAICVVERGDRDGKTYPLLAIKAAIVDGKKIKADTWYKLKNGEFVEVENEES